MSADWLASLMSIERSTVIVLATLCGAGTWILRGQLYNQMLGFVIHPVLTAFTVFIFALLQACGLIEPMILTDQIKGIMAATMLSHGIGLAFGMLVLLLLNDKAAAVENDLTRRQAKLGDKAPVSRKVRRDFRESLR